MQILQLQLAEQRQEMSGLEAKFLHSDAERIKVRTRVAVVETEVRIARVGRCVATVVLLPGEGCDIRADSHQRRSRGIG